MKNLLLSRVYANHILTTHDSQQHTAYTYGVSPTTIRSYINDLKESELEEDKLLYERVKKEINSRKWGYNNIHN